MLEASDHAVADQAAGLRRLFGERSPRVIAFVSGRGACGRTSLLVRSAAALAQAGHGVVIIDENRGPNNVFSAFGLTARHDLVDLLHGNRATPQLAQAAAPLLRVVAACRLADRLSSDPDAASAARLEAGLRHLQQGAAFVLIDCAARRGRLSALALTARQIAVVVAAEGAAITEAYALIKRLARERGREDFQVVVTRARSTEEAQAIFNNLRRTAREHLGVRLDYLGGSPAPLTDHLAEALQTRRPPPADAADAGGFLPFAAGRDAARSTAGHAPARLESVV